MNFDKKLSCTFGMIQNGQIIYLNHLVANNIFYILVLVYRIIFFTDSNNKIVQDMKYQGDTNNEKKSENKFFLIQTGKHIARGEVRARHVRKN